MRKFLKIAGYTVGALVLVVCLAAAGVYWKTGSEAKRIVALPAHDFKAPTDAASVAKGEHFVRAIGKCGDCHGADFSGAPVMDDPAFGMIYAANLTSGRGGLPSTESDADLERAIRHGLAKDGRRLMVMPSQDYQYISDEDLGYVIAYLRSVPAVDKERRPHRLGPIARMLMVTGAIPVFTHDAVHHGEDAVASVPIDTTVAYGKYLGDVGCQGCHGTTYSGGAIPGGPPDWPAPANLTPTGIGHYTLATFTTALREGKRPSGAPINPFMPFAATKLMTDTEITAVFNYLRTLPPKEFGSR